MVWEQKWPLCSFSLFTVYGARPQLVLSWSLWRPLQPTPPQFGPNKKNKPSNRRGERLTDCSGTRTYSRAVTCGSSCHITWQPKMSLSVFSHVTWSSSAVLLLLLVQGSFLKTDQTPSAEEDHVTWWRPAQLPNQPRGHLWNVSGSLIFSAQTENVTLKHNKEFLLLSQHLFIINYYRVTVQPSEMNWKQTSWADVYSEQSLWTSTATETQNKNKKI